MFGLKRRFRTSLASVLDAVIVPRREMMGWAEADYVQRLLRKLDVDCVFDVGGNRGQFGRWLRATGFEGTILSFEPNPAPFADLEKATAADGNWRCFPYALGERDDKLKFNVMALDVFSSFLEPEHESSAFPNENSVIRTIEVPVHTLAAVYGEMKLATRFERPFLKMDTQGYDLRVLAGAKSCINEFCGMLTEVSFRRLYEDAPSFEQSLAAIRAAGFELAGLFAVHPDKTLNLPEMNAYCVRSDLLALEAP
jgi:FkbM family methyltransferase